MFELRVLSVLWSPATIDKLAWKHGVTPDEVEQVLFGRPQNRKVQRGHVPGENLYVAGGQTDAGKFLILFFILKID
jgi:hypothetical protein